MDDHWPDLYEDKYAVKRIEKSVELADIYPGMSVLDIGCHKGELQTYLPVETFYTGIDHLNGHDFDGGFSLGKKFDRILCLEVLEHLKWPRKTAQSIKDHLAPGGVAVISLPNEATLFHRIRSLLGTPDAEAFSENGKHFHLPSMLQSFQFLSEYFEIEHVSPYLSDGSGSRASWLRPILRLFPLQILCDMCPSLFARGFIFVCKKK